MPPPLSPSICSYFIWDFYLCAKHFDIYGRAFFLHALMAIISLTIASRPYGMHMMPYYLLVEFSSIFLNANWMLIKTVGKGHFLYKWCMRAFAASYLLIRIILAPVFVYFTYLMTVNPRNTAPALHRNMFFVNVALLASLSQFWFWMGIWPELNGLKKEKIKLQ